MFRHIYFYKIKTILRNRSSTFWNFFFPILLATLFYMVLSDVYDDENFNTIKVAVIQNTSYDSNLQLKSLLESASIITSVDSLNIKTKDIKGQNDKLFSLVYTSIDEAENLLINNKIDGYIYVNEEINLVVNKSNLQQSILKKFLDYYQQRNSTATNGIELTNGTNTEQILQIIGIQQEYIHNQSNTNSLNIHVIFFYSLIAMTCMYGFNIGITQVIDLQANLSPVSCRVSVSKISKIKMIFASLMAAITTQFISFILLFMYLILILKIDFGKNILLIIIVCFIGVTTGVLFGAALSSFSKKSEEVKIGAIMGIVMLLTFLSGMMNPNVKYLVQENYPIISYLNPVNLITDSLYSLYHYDTYTRYFQNIFILLGMSTILFIITLLKLRRLQYESV